MTSHIQILSLAAERLLPSTIEPCSHHSILTVRGLIRMGLLSGETKYGDSGPVIFNPTTTVEGRRYLAYRSKPRFENSLFRVWLEAKQNDERTKLEFVNRREKVGSGLSYHR